MSITHLAGTVAIKSFACLAAFQAQDSINSGNSKLLMFFIALVAIAMLTQAVMTVVLGIKAMQVQKELMAHLVEFKGKALPLIEKSHTLVQELTPQVREVAAKVETITAHVEYLAALVHEKADEIAPTITAVNQTALDANFKTSAQVSRVNLLVTSALDATARAGTAIEQGVAKSGRGIAGIVAGFQAGFGVMLRAAARSLATPPPVKPATIHAEATDPNSGI